MINISALKAYLENCPATLRVVSFDVFDTLLIRLTESERVAELAADKLSVLLEQNMISDLSSEKILESRKKFRFREENASRAKYGEWTVSEWLGYMANEKGINRDLLLELGRRAELEAEARCVRLAERSLESIELVRERNLVPIATSDTWLDQELLGELLQVFGLNFDRIFSSGTLKASKKRGTIFAVIERHLKLNSHSFVHLGDKLGADFLKPHLAGWKVLRMPDRSVLVRRGVPEKFRVGPLRPKRFEEIVRNIEAEPAPYNSDPYFRLAYNYMAPLAVILSLVQWRRFREQGIESIFYIARDAYIMLDVYNMLTGLLKDDLRRFYIRLSRKAVALAHPDDLLQNAEPVAGKLGRRSVGEWLSNFAVDSDFRQDILSEAGVNENSRFDEKARYRLRTACRGSLLSVIQDRQRDQRNLIKDYLIQQSGQTGLKRVGIVDSGWACTIQDVIRGVLEDADIVSGVYFGVSAQGNRPDEGNLKYGLLRDDFRQARHQNPLEASAGVIRVWDTLLREPVGTVSRLRRLNDGTVEPEIEDQSVIGEIEALAGRSIRLGVRKGTEARLKGISLLLESIKSFSDSDFENTANAFAHRISTYPSREIAKAIMRLGFDEGTASGNEGSLGLRGIREGTAWYPGVLANFGLAWTYPALQFAAKILFRFKLQKRLTTS